MYFSRLIFNLRENRSNQFIKTLLNNNYREHQMLWDLFDKDPSAKRDFLYRQIVERGKVKYYVLSRRKPFDRIGIWQMDGPKIYNPRLKKGQRLFFMLRANPTVFSPQEGGKRHDVVMNEKKRKNFKNLPSDQKPPLHEIVRDSCVKWLNKKADSNGFSFKENEVAVDGYRRIQIYRAKQKNQSNICYSAVDFQGLLTVCDSKKFKSVLEKGIGKSKAFGCGLMLVKKQQ